MKPRLPLLLTALAGLLAIYLIAPLIAGVRQIGVADWRSVDTVALLNASSISIASATTATIVIGLGGVPGRAMVALGFLVQLQLTLLPRVSGILLRGEAA